MRVPPSTHPPTPRPYSLPPYLCTEKTKDARVLSVSVYLFVCLSVCPSACLPRCASASIRPLPPDLRSQELRGARVVRIFM